MKPRGKHARIEPKRPMPDWLFLLILLPLLVTAFALGYWITAPGGLLT